MGNELYKKLESAAQARGIPLIGGVDVEKAEDYFSDHVGFYKKWLERGFHAEMQYLKRGEDRRKDIQQVLPGAKSMFVVAIPYRVRAIERDPSSPKLARYLYGIESKDNNSRDYHDVLKEVLSDLMKEVTEGIDLNFKVCVDTSAVLERTWAYLSGLGWIGKNKMLIHPQYGSYLILGEVIMDKELDRAPRLMKNYCGNCDRCITGCPTKAIDLNKGVNSTRCVSYLTLEHRGPIEFNDDEKLKFGNWVAGCDVCQEVCPFNKKPVKTDVTNHFSELSWDEMFEWALDEDTYKDKVKPTAANRMKKNQLLRNVLISYSNSLQLNETLDFADSNRICERLASASGRFDESNFPKKEYLRCVELLNQLENRNPNK